MAKCKLIHYRTFTTNNPSSTFCFCFQLAVPGVQRWNSIQTTPNQNFWKILSLCVESRHEYTNLMTSANYNSSCQRHKATVYSL